MPVVLHNWPRPPKRTPSLRPLNVLTSAVPSLVYPPDPAYNSFCVFAKANPRSNAMAAPTTGTPSAGNGTGATSSSSAPMTSHSTTRNAR